MESIEIVQMKGVLILSLGDIVIYGKDLNPVIITLKRRFLKR